MQVAGRVAFGYVPTALQTATLHVAKWRAVAVKTRGAVFFFRRFVRLQPVQRYRARVLIVHTASGILFVASRYFFFIGRAR